MTLQEMWGAPAAQEFPQPIRDTVQMVVGMEQQAQYQAFQQDRQQRSTPHPKGVPTSTSHSMAFEQQHTRGTLRHAGCKSQKGFASLPKCAFMVHV